MRPDQIRVGQTIRLSNALRAKVLETTPYDEKYWGFKLEAVKPADVGPFDFVILRTEDVEVVPTLEVVR